MCAHPLFDISVGRSVRGEALAEEEADELFLQLTGFTALFHGKVLSRRILHYRREDIVLKRRQVEILQGQGR